MRGRHGRSLGGKVVAGDDVEHGLQRDVETLLHEGGHAFHSLATRDEDLFAYRNNVPIEFAEVASMSMELLGNEFLDVFYDPGKPKKNAAGDSLWALVWREAEYADPDVDIEPRVWRDDKVEARRGDLRWPLPKQ